MRGVTLIFRKGNIMSDSDVDFSSLILGRGQGSQCSALVIEPEQESMLREQFHVLRFRSFGGWEGSDPWLGQERDRYDQCSPFVVVVWEGVVVAGCRLIDGEQVRITLDSTLIAPGRHFEISRMLIRSEVQDRATRDRVMFTLCQAVAEYAFGCRGYNDLNCDMRLPFYVALHRIFGEHLEKIGERHNVKKHGETLILVPTRIRASSVPAMRQRFMQRLQAPAVFAQAA